MYYLRKVAITQTVIEVYETSRSYEISGSGGPGIRADLIERDGQEVGRAEVSLVRTVMEPFRGMTETEVALINRPLRTSSTRDQSPE